MTKARVYTGPVGRLSGHVLGRVPFAVPETVKIRLLNREAGKPDESGELIEVSGDGRIWLFESGVYIWNREEGVGEGLSPLFLCDEVVLSGYDWALVSGGLVVDGAFVSVEMPCSMPDAGNFGWWVDRCDDSDTAPFVPSLSSVESVFFGRWCYTPLSLTYRWEREEYRKLREAADKAKGLERAALVARLMEVERFEIGDIAGPSGVYGMTWYDCDPAVETEMTEPSFGGLWLDGGVLYGSGNKSAGRALLVPTSFDSDGTCLGLSVVHSGELQGQEPGQVIPVRGGAVHVAAGEGDPRGRLLSVRGPYALHLWGEETRLYEIEEGFLSPRWGYLALPGVLSLDGKVSLWWPYGEIPSKLGGAAKTMERWCFPGEAEPVDAAGPFLVAEGFCGAVITDMRTMRRHIVPEVGDIQVSEGHGLVRSHSANEKVCLESSSPVEAVGKGGERFPQDVKPEDLCIPWLGKAGDPLEIGWWDLPDLGVRGSPPNLEGLGDSDGSNDFHDGTHRDNRKGMSVTSDGLIYLSGDNYEDEALDVMAWKYDGEHWEKNRVSWPCSDRLVAPYGQGNYHVHHFPGADWSLFHAPVGRIRYRKLLETTDWSFLMPLVGLGGGFALHGALMVQEAFNKYLEDSFGDAMLVYTLPNQRMYVGDPLFREWKEVDAGRGYFWTFAGWAMIRDEPMAIFSKLKEATGNDPKPEVWGVCRSGARRIDPEEAGEVGERAAGLIPSTYWARWGTWPGGSGGVKEDIDSILGNQPCLYPLPEPTGNPEAALAEGLVERMDLWREKAQDINRPAVTMGQTYDHQILSAAAIDPTVPLVDARLEVDEEGTTWVMLRHWTGVWLSVRCDVSPSPYVLEQPTEWELVSLGAREDGAIVALFGCGKCSLSVGDFDSMLDLFGFGEWWTRMALHTWYARFFPVVIRQSPDELDRMARLWKEEEKREE
jgi:hypothetical protein